jgi:uncharacterized RDD family membrane protein YckC
MLRAVMNTPLRPQAEPAHLGWRLLSLIYDLLPVLALWMLASVVALALRGGTPITPWSVAFWLQNLALWAIAGVYAVESWRRGGQTLGMRPWRLRVVMSDGAPPDRSALWRRYGWATLSLAAGGLGFLWSLVDGEKRGWHDIASGTQLVRVEKP